MNKASKFEQISILSAGTFTNLILSILFFLLLSGFFILTYSPAGAMFNTYTLSKVNVNGISMLDGINISNPTNLGLIDIIDKNNLTDDLILGGNGNSINLTKIVADDKTYYMNVDILKEGLELNNDYVILYDDFPAINVGLMGAIISIGENEIKTYEDLVEVMKRYNPGEEINIKTKYDDEILEYDLVLDEDPNEEGRAIIGIGILNQKTRIVGKISDFFNFFKKPATNYEPRFNSNLIIFIYNLIWWLALVNISVALVNMLPMGIFDGGRMFMLTMWGITGSERFGKVMYKIATYFILGIFILLMLSWFITIF